MRRIVLVVITSVLLLQARAVFAVTPSDDAVAAFDDLLSSIARIPDADLNKGVRNSLSQKVANAKQQFMRGQVCAAANMLNAFLSEAQAQRRGRGTSAAEGLYASGRQVRGMVVQ